MFNWFKNYAKSTENAEDTEEEEEEDGHPLPPENNKFSKVYKARDAAAILYSEVVSERLAALTSDAPGSPGYLKLYPGVLSEVIDALSKKDQRLLEETAEIWNKRGAPEAMKKKWDKFSHYCVIQLTFA